MEMSDDWTYSDPSYDSLQPNDDSGNGSLSAKPLRINTQFAESSTQEELDSPFNFSRSKIDNAESTSQGNHDIVSSPPKAITIPTPALISGRKNSMSSNQHNLSKAAPANPLTTKHDVESVPVTNSSTSSINETVSDLVQSQQQQVPSTPIQTSNAGNFFNSMFTSAASSLSFGKSTPDTSNRDGNGTISDTDTTVLGDGSSIISSSPNMLSYRRDKKDRRRNISMGSTDFQMSPLNEDNKPFPSSKISEEVDESFDTNLYVDEKFRSTNHRYATITRNEEFHKLFKSIPEYERLLDDFSCAISKEILLQGRMYVTEHNICFNSNLLGWVTNLVIPYSEVTGFEKTATVGLFNNGISVNFRNGKHSFASFISRDSTFTYLEEVWKAAVAHDNDVPNPTKTFLDSHVGAFISKDISLDSNELDNDLYNSALMSIDGDTPRPRRTYSLSIDDEEEDDDDDDADQDDDSDTSSSSSSDVKTETKASNQNMYKLNDDSKYQYDGPYAHSVTKSPYDPEANKETILARENYNCPPGVLYELLFGTNNALTLELLKKLDSSEFTDFTTYEKNEEGFNERSYQYKKGLNYSVGPKSTKCLVKETIEALDFTKYINVVNTTQTPDVPSGGSFSVKTRYIITWGPENTSSLVVSYWVHWISSSWMKGVIEKSCKSGQEAAAKALVDLVKQYVQANTHKVTETVTMGSEDSSSVTEEKQTIEIAQQVNKAAVTQIVSDSGPSFTLFNLLVLSLLSIILVFQVLIFRSLSYKPVTSFSLKSLNGMNANTEKLLFKGEEILLWNWIDDRAGKVDGSKEAKTKSIKKDIDVLISKWATGELNTNGGEALLADFEKKLNDYVNDSSDLIQEKRIKSEQLKEAIQALL